MPRLDIPKGLDINSMDVDSAVAIAAPLTVARKWKQPKCPSMGNENVAHIHQEDYSAVRKNETMTISEKPMDLVNIPNEETQTQKDRHPTFLICGSHILRCKYTT